jgi:Phytanoyl-CoA dioxygenase (PhyH)
MSLVQDFPAVTSLGDTLDPQYLGLMNESSPEESPDVLRQRMHDDGYLLLRNLFDRDAVLDVRAEVAKRLHANGYLMPGTDPNELVANPDKPSYFMPEVLANDNKPLRDLLYGGTMIEFFESYFGEPVRHYDFTWFRSVWPGKGTPAHCDIVYMGRGERERLHTAWTPIGDIDFTTGGLIVLEKSHQHERLRATYCQRDVDTYCTNKGQHIPDSLATTKDHDKSWGERFSGWLAGSPNTIRKSIGGRWLTTEYNAGDLLVFSMYLVHGSLDNASKNIRLSSDSRYQPASTPADERWIGANPVGHSRAGKRGRIC